MLKLNFLNEDLRNIVFILDDIILDLDLHWGLKIQDGLTFALICFLGGLFIVGMNKKNFILFTLGVELMLLGIILNFILFSILQGSPLGQIYALFIITLATTEAAIGLGLFIAAYSYKKSLSFQSLNDLT